MPSSLPAKKKPASPAKKPSGSVKKPAGPAKKPAGPAKKPAGPAKKQAGPAKKQAGPAKKQAGPLKKPAGSVKKPAGPAKKQAGTSKKQAGHVKKQAGPVRKAPYYRATSGDGIGEWKLYGIKVTNPWYKDTKYVLSAPVSEGTILPVGLVGVRGEYDVRPVKGKGVFVSVHLKNDLSGLWEPRKGGIRVKLGTKTSLALSTPSQKAVLHGKEKIVKEILEKIEKGRGRFRGSISEFTGCKTPGLLTVSTGKKEEGKTSVLVEVLMRLEGDIYKNGYLKIKQEDSEICIDIYNKNDAVVMIQRLNREGFKMSTLFGFETSTENRADVCNSRDIDNVIGFISVKDTDDDTFQTFTVHLSNLNFSSNYIASHENKCHFIPRDKFQNGAKYELKKDGTFELVKSINIYKIDSIGSFELKGFFNPYSEKELNRVKSIDSNKVCSTSNYGLCFHKITFFHPSGPPEDFYISESDYNTNENDFRKANGNLSNGN